MYHVVFCCELLLHRIKHKMQFPQFLPRRHSKHTFECLVQFPLSLQLSSPFVVAFSQVPLYVKRTSAGIWWAQLAGDGAAQGSTTAFTPILLNYTTGLQQTRCSLVQTRFFYDKT